MTRISCKCGNVIGTGSFPNNSGFRIISELSYDELDTPLESEGASKFFFNGKEMYKCNKCERIFVYWNETLSVYNLEENS